MSLFSRFCANSFFRFGIGASFCTLNVLTHNWSQHVAFAKSDPTDTTKETLQEQKRASIFAVRVKNFRRNLDLLAEATDIIKAKGHRTSVTFVIHNHMNDTEYTLKNTQVYSYGGKWRKAPRKSIAPGDANVAIATHPSGSPVNACTGIVSFDLDDCERRIHLMYWVPGGAGLHDSWLSLAVTPTYAKPDYNLWYAMNYGSHIAVDTRQLVKKGKWRWVKVRQGLKRRSAKDACIEMPRFNCKVFAEMDGRMRSECHLHFLPLNSPLPYKFKEYIIAEQEGQEKFTYQHEEIEHGEISENGEIEHGEVSDTSDNK